MASYNGFRAENQSSGVNSSVTIFPANENFICAVIINEQEVLLTINLYLE